MTDNPMSQEEIIKIFERNLREYGLDAASLTKIELSQIRAMITIILNYRIEQSLSGRFLKEQANEEQTNKE
jgi:ubiquinone biosynthesis protein COQ9